MLVLSVELLTFFPSMLLLLLLSLQSCPTRGGDLNCLSPVQSQWDKTVDTVNKIGVPSLVGRGLEARSQTKSGCGVGTWAQEMFPEDFNTHVCMGTEMIPLNSM